LVDPDRDRTAVATPGTSLNRYQPGLHSFVRGIRRDQEAVTAGLALDYSSGALEGRNCKTKHIKRLMYGRANFDLLRKMALLN
jgi:transposase